VDGWPRTMRASSSTETGDAWLLEPSSINSLARDGDLEPFHQENETT
jgi:hypothetical protein